MTPRAPIHKHRTLLGRAEARRSYCLRSAAPAGARDRDRARRPARPGRAAATALVVGLALLGAAPAEAQTARILVSNSAQSADDSANTSGNDHAQLFHTGGNTAGYILTSVHVNTEDAEGDDFDVEICEEDGTANEFPSTIASNCTALTAPNSFVGVGNPKFTHATGLALSANTNYVVVIKQRGTESVELNSTPSAAEDTSLGLSDWSIKDTFYWINSGAWTVKSGANEALRIIVNGYASTVDTTDATLSALSVSGATLSPAFDAATTNYGVVVANSVTQVTVTHMTNELTATVAPYTDASNNPLTDADGTTPGFQFALSPGDQSIKVRVTAPDGITELDYNIEIVRRAAVASCSAAAMVNPIWTGNLTAGQLGLLGLFGFISFSGDLDDTTFSYGGTNYTISSVTSGTLFGSTGFEFALDGNFGTAAADLVLHVGNTQYRLDDATLTGNTYKWTSNIPSWANGDAACLALTVAGPDVSSVALTSAPGADNTYGIGDAVEATVTFDAAVDIAGTPQLELDFNGTAKAAACTTATNTTTMVCSYTVVVGDSAPNGVGIAANKLTGGTIYATGSTTTSADLTHSVVAIDTGHKVDGIRPTLVTTGSNAPTTSTDGTQVILTFSETIGTVDRSKIDIGIGGGNIASTSAANVVAGTKVELDLSTFIDATVMLTVALDLSAVEDGVGNGNLAVAATPVTNAITANEPPEFSSPTAMRSVPENTAANTNIGTALPAATDGDNDPLTYTLEDADAASFAFNAATRQLSTKSGVTYDHETTPSYSVTLKADDDNGGTDTLAVTITITDVEEPPGRPAAPSVTATAGTTDSLSVNWTTPSNSGPAIDNYDLQYREGTSGSWINGPQNVSATSATIGSLTEGTSYQVQVLARNAEGDSPWSLPGSGQTGALGAPDVPHSLDATPGNRQVMLSWVQPSGGAEVAGYEYELDGSGTWISTGSTDTDYTVRNLTNGQPYTFKVRAANSAGQSAASTASASVTPATVPGAPTGLSATVSDQRVDLIWTAPASNGGQSITDYEYEQGGSGTWISTGGTATSYMVHNLTNGQPYRFRVRALNSVGAGAASAASPNITPATEPGAPTGLGATVSDQEVDLIWTAPASNGEATILRYEYELDLSDTWTSTGGTTTSYTVTGLTNGQSYTFRVRAVNRVGAGLVSSSRSATPTSTVLAPDTPFGLSATPGNGQVMLSWVQPSGGAALTDYEYEQDGSGTWTSTGGKAPSYTVTGLNNGQTYTFRVRAVNSAGPSAASGSRTATPTTTAPEAPESLSFTPGDQQVTLRWRAPTNDGGEPITHYEYEQDGSGTWISTGSTDTSHTVRGLNNGQTYMFRVRAVNTLGNGAVVTLEATPSASTGRGGGGGGGPRITRPGAPENLLAEGGDGQVTLTWEAPEDDGGSEITDYQYRINGRNPWTSIGSTQTTHTLTGLVNGTEYVFEVRAVNRIGRGRASSRAEATPEAPEVFTLDFAHFANGTGITSEMVLVNVAPHPIRPAIYFYDRGGHLIDPESVVEVTGDLEVTEDGSLSVLTEMEPLGELTISTHGQGELVSGSVKVLSDGPIGGGVRYGLPEIGVAGVGAGPPVRDVLFPARRQEGGMRTATALHNLGEEAVGVRCRLMSGGVALEEAEIPLEANGQTSWFIEEAFPTTDTSDFLGSVRCTVLGSRRFTAIAVEMDAAQRIFNTLSVVPLDRTGGGNKQTTLDFAHFVNGTWITDLVFVNLSTEASRPAPSPFHTDILPSRPAIYFYDTAGNPIAAESVVDITGDLEISEDGALTVRTEMEPLGVLTISTHGRGERVTGSARVVSEGPIGGMLRFEHPDFGVAGVGASPPLSDALFPVRRQEGGITTGVALHNLESSPGLLHCDLMREGVLLDAASIPLEANGQTSWLIDQAFPAADTSDFAGSVRCDAVGQGLFSAVALEMDPSNRIFATLPVVPVPQMPDRE